MRSSSLACALVLWSFTVAPQAQSAASSPSTEAPPGANDDDRVRAALAKVRELRDAVDPKVLTKLAQGRDAAALGALEEAARLLAAPSTLELVYSLIAGFRGDAGLEERAAGVLEDAALGAQPMRRLPATAALVAFGDPGIDALGRVLRRSDDELVRATALGPLLPGLRIQGTMEALDTFLECWRQPESGSYEASVRLLAGFRDAAHLGRLERVLGERGTAPELRNLILDALTYMPHEGADGVLVRSLDSQDEALVVAVIQALEARSTPGAERELDRLTDSGPLSVRAAAWIALAGRAPVDSRFRRRVGLLVKHTAPELRSAAATVLGRSRFDGVTEGVAQLLADEQWSVRDAALDACVELRDPALVPLLIERLDVEAKGRRDRVRDTLVLLTAQDHGGSSARWSAWWKAEGSAQPLATHAAALAFVESRPKQEAGEGRSTVQFFGIPVESDRVSFVVDSSGSMSAPTGTSQRTRIDAAKESLIGVLDRLDLRARFNIVWFASGTSSWRGRLSERTPRNLRMAKRFVEERRADGGTALYDGLVAAWSDRSVEAIYLLTDGAPSAGRIVDPGEILVDLRARYERRPVVVHCIAVGTPSQLLESIAELTGGVYRVVD